MADFRDHLIEVGARALCGLHHRDPDGPRYGPEAFADLRRKYQPVGLLWEEYADDAATVIDAVFEGAKQKAA